MFCWWSLLLAWSCLVVSAPLERRDADFESVRTRLRKTLSGKAGDPQEKYFHESIFHPHYDGRFAEKTLSYAEKMESLPVMVQAYLATMRDLGLETWLVHGSLLGWWWNRKTLPWDTDVDVQVAESTMHFLAEYYNMTTYRYQSPQFPQGRFYMIEVNPNYAVREGGDPLNTIDARWVDMDTGLFIDITAVRRNFTRPEPDVFSCKDGHDYRENQIFPLRDSTFEGKPVKVPYAYTELLKTEYGSRALTLTSFEHHLWNETTQIWEPQE
ncbi:MAG: hypothetical protein M1838_004261 [Thelocarpon superellum]|nr:MAG: hypothetical protein M1838_004261 [Thelocarpon superellum]